MRHITQNGLNLIKRFEGISRTVYFCPAGYPTIGYGHVVRDDEKQQFAEGIDKEEGEKLLRQDVRWAERGVLRFIDVPLTDGQFDALVSFTYNLGGGALQRSTLRRKVNRGEHDGVPAELMKWVWAAEKKLPGLVRRRQAEGVAYASAPLAGMKIEKDSWGKPEQGDIPPGLSHMRIDRLCKEVLQETVFPGGAFEFATDRSIRGFEPGEVESDFFQ